MTPWTVSGQAPPSMGFPRQEYCHGLPSPSPGDLSHPEIKPSSPTLQVDSLLLSHQVKLWEILGRKEALGRKITLDK